MIATFQPVPWTQYRLIGRQHPLWLSQLQPPTCSQELRVLNFGTDSPQTMRPGVHGQCSEMTQLHLGPGPSTSRMAMVITNTTHGPMTMHQITNPPPELLIQSAPSMTQTRWAARIRYRLTGSHQVPKLSQRLHLTHSRESRVSNSGTGSQQTMRPGAPGQISVPTVQLPGPGPSHLLTGTAIMNSTRGQRTLQAITRQLPELPTHSAPSTAHFP